MLENLDIILNDSDKDWIEKKGIPEVIVEDAEDAEKRRAVVEMIDQLPEKQKVVVYLYYFPDKSTKEIAEIQAVQEGTIYLYCSLSRKKEFKEIYREYFWRKSKFRSDGSIYSLLFQYNFYLDF